MFLRKCIIAILGMIIFYITLQTISQADIIFAETSDTTITKTH